MSIKEIKAELNAIDAALDAGQDWEDLKGRYVYLVEQLLTLVEEKYFKG